MPARARLTRLSFQTLIAVFAPAPPSLIALGGHTAALQALAGPQIGPGGGQIFIDGFSGANLPPRESIREIRINQNPFAAENDQPSGRIDILTKPGTDKFRGSLNGNFTDVSFGLQQLRDTIARLVDGASPG